MEIRFNGLVTTHDRITVTATRSEESTGEFMLEVRKPTRAESGLRRLLNAFTLGLYTRNVENPRQWAALKACLLLQAHGKLDDVQVQSVLDTYGSHSRLSAGKLAVVYDDFKRALATGSGFVPRSAHVRPLEASQSLLARGANTVGQRLRFLTTEERALRQRAEVLVRTGGGEGTDSAKRMRCLSGAEALLSVLRPGRPIGSDAISMGVASLQRLAQKEGVPYGCARANHPQSDMESVRYDALEQMTQQGFDPKAEAGLFTIPLGFGGTRLHPENHVVNLTIDFKHQQLLYLDAKALPVEEAERYYPNGVGLTTMLERVGRDFWGPQWQLASGLVQLELPKQMGANDCGAFTHHFTRCLLKGESVGDIERHFSVQDRAQLRVQMAKDIASSYID